MVSLSSAAVQSDKKQILAWRIEGVRSKGKAGQGGGEVRMLTDTMNGSGIQTLQPLPTPLRTNLTENDKERLLIFKLFTSYVRTAQQWRERAV